MYVFTASGWEEKLELGKFKMKSENIELRDAIYKRLDELFYEASGFYRAWLRETVKKEVSLSNQRSSGGDKKTANYQLKIERNGPSFTIRWLAVNFIKSNGKAVRIVKNIATPKFGRYTKGNFRLAADWELEMIESLEDVLAPIRMQTKGLMKMHQSLISVTKATGDNFESIDIKDRVTYEPMDIKKYKESLM